MVFRLTSARHFFSGPLKQFEKIEHWTNMKGKKYTRFRIADMIDAIGEGGCCSNACMIFAYRL